MNNLEWDIFTSFKNDFKEKIQEWTKRIENNSINLLEIEKKVAFECGTPEYSLETPIVYNKDLDKITKNDEIKLIVIGDNPGKDEQLNINNRYLVGQAGKIAEGFFRKNPELQIDFRKNVVILNKTPVHTAKTNQLKMVMKEGGDTVEEIILDSQKWISKRISEFHQEMNDCGSRIELWLVGYSELKEKGIFCPFKDVMKESYIEKKAWEKVFVFQHFSMNRFSIDLKNNYDDKKSLLENIHFVGKIHKDEIF